MAFHLSTKSRLLLLLKDMELISKEMIENMIAPKHQRLSPAEHAALVDLLVSKDVEFREMLELAAEQAKVENNMNEVRAKVNVYAAEIQKLQTSLKEAEQVISTAIFQVRQKIESINQANKRKVSSEEIIKYAHRISAANAVSAPISWSVGDVRRPYPTDMEMRNGFLGKSDLNINSSGTSQSSMPTQRGGSSSNPEMPNAFPNQFGWNNLGELHMSMGAAGSVPLETRAPASQDDVEVMSTDSSSSSSSDSQ